MKHWDNFTCKPGKPTDPFSPVIPGIPMSPFEPLWPCEHVWILLTVTWLNKQKQWACA